MYDDFDEDNFDLGAEDYYEDDSWTDHDTLVSIGWGEDESYGYFGQDTMIGGCDSDLMNEY